MKNVSIFAALLLSAVIFSNKSNAQQNQSAGGVLPNFSTATPLQITNEIFRFRPGLVTHLLNGDLPTGTVGFGATDRWLSFGQVGSTTNPLLQGFRTQAAGRGLAIGHTLSNESSPISSGNPFVEWIGNGTIMPGNLDFRYAVSPTGSIRENVLTIEPVTLTNPFNFKGYTYARANCLIGQL